MLRIEGDMRASSGARNSGRSTEFASSRRNDADSVRQKVESSYRRRALWRTALLLIAALMATFAIWRLVALDSRQDGERVFHALVNKLGTELRDAIFDYTQVMRGGAALFNSIGDVSRETWRAYVTLEINNRYPGLQGVGFAAAVRPTEIAAHVSQVRAEGLSDYAIRPDGVRPFYAPILYPEPEEGSNRRALGYDMFSDPVRRAAMESARDTGLARLSGKVALVHENPEGMAGDGAAGIVLYWPLYQPGTHVVTVDDRRAALRGWIYVLVRVDDFVRRALGRATATDNVHIEIIDGETASEAARLYDSAGVTPSTKVYPSKLSATVWLDLFGRTWTVRASSLPAFENSVATPTAFTVLVAGALVSGLMAAVAWSANRRQIEAVEAAARLQLIADTSPSILWLSAPDGTITWASHSWYRYTDVSPEAGVRAWAEFVHPDDRERWCGWVLALRDGLPYEIEVRYRRHDGRHRWFITRAAPERDPSGQVVTWFVVTTDIDDLKRPNGQSGKAKAGSAASSISSSNS
jgi:PAS domain S-box-containing protein